MGSRQRIYKVQPFNWTNNIQIKKLKKWDLDFPSVILNYYYVFINCPGNCFIGRNIDRKLLRILKKAISCIRSSVNSISFSLTI